MKKMCIYDCILIAKELKFCQMYSSKRSPEISFLNYTDISSIFFAVLTNSSRDFALKVQNEPF